jgi:hypothetical protein
MAMMRVERAILFLLRGRIAGAYFPMDWHARAERAVGLAAPLDLAVEPALLALLKPSPLAKNIYFFVDAVKA